jgi:serine/threonine protein phosphatase PrpC
VRLETAAWTTTGMVRTGNEDSFALLHGVQAQEDELTDTALVLLCDGMGGYEAGEVAARMTIEELRKTLVPQRPFSSLRGEVAVELDVDACLGQIEAALKHANRHIFSAARAGIGRRGMGCTAEVVYVHGRHLLVGHVGDSRVYLLHQNQLTQLTRDHTLVNRLVELGQLTPEEAAEHPRRSGLQQAIGGHADVEVELHHRVLHPGDWIVVCSDGLSNHVLPKTLKEMLLTAGSAEVAARRLVNLTNLEGATDNATVVVLRVT